MTESVRQPSAQFSITATLPFPLRLAGGPYSAIGRLGKVELSFETIRRQNFDERIASGGTGIDFEVDRYGWASYSRVSATVVTEGGRRPLVVFLDGLNRLIRHLRNDLNLYWLYELEAEDLFLVTILDGVDQYTLFNSGRAKGVHLAITGLSSKAEAMLRQRLDQGESVAEWRLLQLDADEAFETGKYEQAVLLGWTALETACRTETPRLAREAGLSVSELTQRLYEKPPKLTPFSFEQAIEDAHIMAIIRQCAELAGAGYDSGSLAESVRVAYRLRNVVAHRGLRLSQSQARRALDAIVFVLGTLNLLRTHRPEPFDIQGWAKHFGAVSIDFPNALGAATGRLVIYRQNNKSHDLLTSWFELEYADSVWTVKIPEHIAEPAEPTVAALTIVTNDSFGYHSSLFPSLQVAPHARTILVSGLLDDQATGVTAAAYWAYAARKRTSAGLAVEAACEYALESIWRGLKQMQHPIEADDARFIILATRIASYFVNASANCRRTWVHKISPSHSQLLTAVERVADLLDGISVEDPHTICDALRGIHSQTWWLDSIVVDCPIEGFTYGTRKAPRVDN